MVDDGLRVWVAGQLVTDTWRLNDHVDYSGKIEGHTDNLGDPNLNMELSKNRAQKIANYLIKNGIAPERLRAFGYGGSRSIEERNTPDARANNRRGTFHLVENR